MPECIAFGKVKYCFVKLIYFLAAIFNLYFYYGLQSKKLEKLGIYMLLTQILAYNFSTNLLIHCCNSKQKP